MGNRAPAPAAHAAPSPSSSTMNTHATMSAPDRAAILLGDAPWARYGEWAARSAAAALFTVSSNSRCGTESATIPAPA